MVCSTTLLIESSISRSVTSLRLARMAYIPASVTTDRTSAPVVFGQRRASSSHRMPRSQFTEREWICKVVVNAKPSNHTILTWKILVRASRSGRPNSTLRSRRPGRRSAGSSVSGRFVAIRTCKLHAPQYGTNIIYKSMTLMFPRASKPSSCVTISSIVR